MRIKVLLRCRMYVTFRAPGADSFADRIGLADLSDVRPRVRCTHSRVRHSRYDHERRMVTSIGVWSPMRVLERPKQR